MQHDVAVPDELEHFLGVGRPPHDARREIRIFQLGPVQPRELDPVAESKPVRRAEQHAFVDVEVVDEDVHHAPRRPRLDLEQRRRAVAQLTQPLVDGLQQIIRFVLLDDHVGVAHDPEDVRAPDSRAGKQRLHVRAHHVLEEHEHRSSARNPRRQRQKTRNGLRELDPRELGTPVVLDDNGQVFAQVGDVREWVPGIDGQRCQHGGDLPLEVPGKVRRHGRRVVLRVEQADALLVERGPKHLGPAGNLTLDHLQRPRPHQRELLFGGESVGGDGVAIRPQLLVQRRHANHEELVEVRPDDGQESHPLEQRVPLVPRQGQHPFVECKPAELPVDEERRILQRGSDVVTRR